MGTATWLIWYGFAPPTSSIVFVLLAPLVFAPGIGIASRKFVSRMQNFKLRYLQSRYGQIRRELVDARRIHESLLPTPCTSDTILFDFRYDTNGAVQNQAARSQDVPGFMCPSDSGTATTLKIAPKREIMPKCQAAIGVAISHATTDTAIAVHSHCFIISPAVAASGSKRPNQRVRTGGTR